MIEIEAKFKISEEEKKKIIELLGKPNFFLQNNIFYKIRKGWIRLRTEKNMSMLTLKGKRKKQRLNAREEIEFKFKSFEKSQIKKLIKLAGFIEIFRYKKYRANYILNDCIVSIDVLPDNQAYLEIEGKEQDIYKVIAILNLAQKTIERRSYLEILNV